MNKRIDITYDLMFGMAIHMGRASKDDAELFNGHPQEVLKKLGITYTVAVPQSLYDCWQLWGCENIPEKLPEFLRVKDYGDPRGVRKCLSEAQINKIIDKFGEHKDEN